MLFIATGGTIDKLPSYLADGKTFDHDSKIFGKTHIPEMLSKANFLGKFSVRTLFMVDSLDMTDEHRKLINEAIEDADDDRVIITHGTDTMPETARFLNYDGRQRFTDRTVVLTGAMVPYSVGAESDAMFNIGNALAYVEQLPSGVYVAMNGQPFEADNVRKDVEAGVFRTIR